MPVISYEYNVSFTNINIKIYQKKKIKNEIMYQF